MIRLYYPGCSLKSSGKPYEESLLAVFEALGEPLAELPDWNCCGATAYMSVDETAAFALALRNLALAEQRGDSGDRAVDLVAPCAACYLVLHKTQHHLADYPASRSRLLDRLDAAGLRYDGRVRVRHPLDVLVHDIGIARIRARVHRPLDDLAVACYYGCQLVRPYADFDDADHPQTMDRLVHALGAETVEWPLKTRCCGGTLTGTIRRVGLRLAELLMNEARQRGATTVATACPLCQFNLETHPSARRTRDRASLPVVYFTQLVGLAFDIPRRRLGLERLLVPASPARTTAAPAGAHHA
jgi:heterodisulfide reductase subunit B